MARYETRTFWVQAALAGAVDAAWLSAHPRCVQFAVEHLHRGATSTNSADPVALPEALADAAVNIVCRAGRRPITAEVTDPSDPGSDSNQLKLTGIELATLLMVLPGLPDRHQLRILGRFRDPDLLKVAALNPTSSAKVLARAVRRESTLAGAVAIHPNISPTLRTTLWSNTIELDPAPPRIVAAWAGVDTRRRDRILSGLTSASVSLRVIEAMWPVVVAHASPRVQRAVAIAALSHVPNEEPRMPRLLIELAPETDWALIEIFRAASTIPRPERAEQLPAVAAGEVGARTAAEHAATNPEWLSELVLTGPTVLTAHEATIWHRLAERILAGVVEPARPAAASTLFDVMPSAAVAAYLPVERLYTTAEDTAVPEPARCRAIRTLSVRADADHARVIEILRSAPTLLSAYYAAQTWESAAVALGAHIVMDAPACCVPNFDTPEVVAVCHAALEAAGGTALFIELCDGGFPGTFSEALACVELART